jgi:Uma2 family endonuclease
VRPAKIGATYQDVIDAPENMIAELLDGDLYLSPRPKGPHTSVASQLGSLLGSRFSHGAGGPGESWIILDEPELHLGKRVMVPDLAGWRTSRMTTVPDEFTVAPDWICEIASKSTYRLDRKRKLPAYAAAGVKHAWMVHPVDRSLEVLRRSRRHWLEVGFFTDDDKVHAEPFESYELDLSRLWWGMPMFSAESSLAMPSWW